MEGIKIRKEIQAVVPSSGGHAQFSGYKVLMLEVGLALSTLIGHSHLRGISLHFAVINWLNKVQWYQFPVSLQHNLTAKHHLYSLWLFYPQNTSITSTFSMLLLYTNLTQKHSCDKQAIMPLLI